MVRRVVILGSTGSLGRQALEVALALPDRLEVVGLAAGTNVRLLSQQVARFKPRYVWHAPAPLSPEVADEFASNVRTAGSAVLPMAAMVAEADVDLVLITTAGKAGLEPTFVALAAHKMVALANKEVLVMAGHLVMAEARRQGVEIWPVDSEHSAIWQCLRGETAMADQKAAVERMVLTASGGAFRDMKDEQLARVTPAQALNHPTWAMGKKVTVDSASLMNKGLEVIEAHHLFGLPYEAIEVVLHRESVVHSLVEFVDGSVKAQLAPADMRMPIQYALTYPDRLPSSWPRLELTKAKNLTFEPVDYDRYPCLKLALEAGRLQGTHPAVLSAADEQAVAAFLAGTIGFLDIPLVVERVLAAHHGRQNPTLEEVLDADAWAARKAQEVIGEWG